MAQTQTVASRRARAGFVIAAVVAGALAAPTAAQAADSDYNLTAGGVRITVQDGTARVTQGSVTDEVPLTDTVVVTSGGTSTTNRLRVNTSGLGAEDTLTIRLHDAHLRSSSSPITLSGSGAGTLKIELLGDNIADSSGDAGVSVLTSTDTVIDVPAGRADAEGSLTASAINSAGIGAYTVLGRAADPGDLIDPDDPDPRLPGVHEFPDWHLPGAPAPGQTYEGDITPYAGEGHGVTIRGGTVRASSIYGAGIGGAEGVNGADARPVVILGGRVTASSEHGAGIGGGNGGSWSRVSIGGGFVEASSLYGEALGGGWTGGSRTGSAVWIDGGTVLAHAERKPAFANRDPYGVTIAGGSVQATGQRGATALGALSQPVFPAVARLLPDTDGQAALLRPAADADYGTVDVVTTTMRAGTPGTNDTPGWVSPWLPAADGTVLLIDHQGAGGEITSTATYSGDVVANDGGHLRMPLPAPTVAAQERVPGDPATITATLAITDLPATVGPVGWAVLPASATQDPEFQDDPVFTGLEPETAHRAVASVAVNDWYHSPSESPFTTIAATDEEGGEEGGEGTTPPTTPPTTTPPTPPACGPDGQAALCETGGPGGANSLVAAALLLLAGVGTAWVARRNRSHARR